MADPVVTSHNAKAPNVESGSTVSISLDGRTVEAAAGDFLIAAAEKAGVYIPRFCYHPRMKPVGMCRMCLVEVSGPRGATLQPACYMPVADGMEVVTTSEKVRKAQDGVLEFLLVNHPLDCPVCDKGGECPLQDQVLAYGPGESRFVEEKRHWAKPLPISELVLLDRERCIQCGRCVRFANEVAGEAQIDFVGRGDQIEVSIFEEHPFASYFSGNTVQICPVGALTSTAYRFTARPWDLDQVESTCTTCALGCRVAVQSSTNRVTRMLGIDSDPVNHSWLCDKGRYGLESVNSSDRLDEPLLRRNGGELERVSWGAALAAVADHLRGIPRSVRAQSIGVIGGARLSNEDAYAWAKLAKGVLGTDSVDAQIGDGLPAELVLGLPRATIDETCAAKCVVTLSGDVREELPVLFLRLREAVVDNGTPLVEITPTTTSVSAFATSSLLYRPGDAAALASALGAGAGGTRPDTIDEASWQAALGALAAAGPQGEGVVVVFGRPSLAEHGAVTAQAVAALAAAWPQARFLPALRRGNVMGALDMGLAPGMLPGRVSLDEGRQWYGDAWGSVPEARGLDTAGILEAAAEGTINTLVLLGGDPLGDFPDHKLARDAIDRATFVIAVDSFLSPSSWRADVVLPAAMAHERSGTTTNIEGRVSRLGQKLVAPGQCWPDWMIAAELAARLGGDLGVTNEAELWDEIERLAPSHAGVTRPVLDSTAGRDGIIVPLTASPVQLTRRGALRPFDPMATPGIEAVERQGAPPRAGMAEQSGGEDTVDSNGAAPTRPKLLSWPQPISAPPHLPPTDGYSLRLVSARRLYDDGVLLESCPELSALVPGAPVVRTHSSELERLGLKSGDLARLRSARGAVVLEVAVDDGVPRGSVEVAFNQGGANRSSADTTTASPAVAEPADRSASSGAAALITAGDAVADVRLETV